MTAPIPCPFADDVRARGERLSPNLRLASCYVESDGSMHGLAEVPLLANHDAVRDRIDARIAALIVENAQLRTEVEALRRDRAALVKAQRDWRRP